MRDSCHLQRDNLRSHQWENLSVPSNCLGDASYLYWFYLCYLRRCVGHSSQLFYIMGKASHSNIFPVQHSNIHSYLHFHHNYSVQLDESPKPQQGHCHVPKRSGEGNGCHFRRNDDPLVLWLYWLLLLYENKRHGCHQHDAIVPSSERLVWCNNVFVPWNVVQEIQKGP